MSLALSGSRAGELLNSGNLLSYCKEQLVWMSHENWGVDVVEGILNAADLPVQYLVFQSYL